jgi:hypothetical protein
MRVRLRLLPAAVGFALGIAAFPVAHGEADKDMTVVMRDNFVSADPEKVKWVSNKSTPGGMMLVMIYGDPSKPGPYIFRARMASGYKLPPHRHPDERIVTVLNGTYWSGVGEQYDPMKMNEYQPGAFYITKANVPHFAWARTEVIIQEQGMGPVENGITYVNLDDDPRRKH